MRGRPRKGLIIDRIPAEGWRERGFVRVPATESEARLALASREYFDSLPCSTNVQEMLGRRESPASIGSYLQRVAPAEKQLAPTTLQKYCQSYWRYFVAPSRPP